MGPVATTSLVSNLEAGLRIFAVGFTGVFLNLALIMGVLKAIGWGAGRYEAHRKAQEANGAKDGTGDEAKSGK